MISQVNVFYQGWGERWHWGTLYETTSISGRPSITFEYSDEALRKGLELSALTLPLAKKLHQDFPAHQLHLPGPVYDALPDGWGMLLMDRLFKREGIDTARVSPLHRLCYIADSAMGALTFEPELDAEPLKQQEISLLNLAKEVTQVLEGENGEFLLKLLKMGGSPQGARPKILLYKDKQSAQWCNLPTEHTEAWLVKFPASQEQPEVCAVEQLYSYCLGLCEIERPESEYIALPDGLAAFASKRFDRQGDMRIPMQSLAAFTGADYRQPGSLDYKNFLRATFLCTRDMSQKKKAFERAVFNVVFNNRDDHPKNFSYLMNAQGEWQLAPAYDVTYCEGPAGYHQMDVMGEALDISRTALLKLGMEEAELSQQQATDIIQRHCDIASNLANHAQEIVPDLISKTTLNSITQRIESNIKLLLG